MLVPVILALLAQQPVSGELAQPARQVSLQGNTHHVQGIDTDGVTLWVTSVDRSVHKGYLMSFLVKDGSLQRTIELEDGERFHPGGISADGDSVWLPVAEYKAHSSSVIQRRNKKTLELEFQFSVDDHIGCIAVTPDFLIGGNWDSKDFYVWDRSGNLKRKISSTTTNSYQDVKWVAGALVASGTMADRRGAVDWLALPDLRLTDRMFVGSTDRGQSFAREGMTIFRKELWMLPEDENSRLFIFQLPAKP